MIGDKAQTLSIVDVTTGALTVVDQSTHNDITDYVWSPDSRYVAYVKDNAVGFSSIWIYSLRGEAAVQVTSDDTNDVSPVFDPKGRYLYFLSSRDYDLEFGSLEFNYMVTNSLRVYAAQLNDNQPALFLPKSDEAGVGSDEDGDGEDEEATEEVKVEIGFAGLGDRVVCVAKRRRAFIADFQHRRRGRSTSAGRETTPR